MRLSNSASRSRIGSSSAESEAARTRSRLQSKCRRRCSAVTWKRGATATRGAPLQRTPALLGIKRRGNPQAAKCCAPVTRRLWPQKRRRPASSCVGSPKASATALSAPRLLSWWRGRRRASGKLGQRDLDDESLCQPLGPCDPLPLSHLRVIRTRCGERRAHTVTAPRTGLSQGPRVTLGHGKAPCHLGLRR